jgi:hypothetical protein
MDVEETKELEARTDTPKSLDEVILGMKGFGIEEVEEILNFKASGKKVGLRISNIPTDSEMKALLAAEEFKGYAWIQRIRCEILSRAITWVNEIDIRGLTEEQRVVVDPTSKDGARADIQIVLRNILLSWGQEVLQTLWKILMVHSDKIEKRMRKDFPDSTLMTEVEQRFSETALKEIRDANREVIEDTVAKVLDEELDPEERAKLGMPAVESLKKE